MSQLLMSERNTWPTAGRLPARSKVMAFGSFGPPEVLQPRWVDTPLPGDGEVALRVAAVSVGRMLDLRSRAGTHAYAQIALPHVLGAEHAGTVAAVGPGVTTVRPGDHVAVRPALTCGSCPACIDGAEEACSAARVIGVNVWGGYAEYSVVPEANLTVVPEGVSPTDAAALSLAAAVAQNQFDQAGLRPGEWVLVQAASSALGSVTVALAAHLGARVIAASRSPQKRDALRELPVAAVVDPTDPAVTEQVRELTGGCGPSIVVDNIGDPQLWRIGMEVLAVRGRVVTSGAFVGGKVELDLLRLYSRAQRVIGVRTASVASTQRMWAAVADGLRPVVDKVYPISQAADAHRHLEDSANTGRVVLTTSDDDWPDVADEVPDGR